MSEQQCFHCGLLVSDPQEFTLKVESQTQSFCCAGCQAVTSMIIQGGLEQFYQYRSSLNQRAEQQISDYTAFDRSEIQQSFVNVEGKYKQARLLLDGITCAACVWLIENFLSRIDGVHQIRVNASTHQCTLTWDPQCQSLSHIMAQLAIIGYRPYPFSAQEQRQQLIDRQRKLLMRLGVAGFAMMQVGMVAIALYAGGIQGMDPEWIQLLRWVSLLVATPVVLFSAQPFWSAAWRSLIHSALSQRLRLTMDVPVSLAILLAYLASMWATLTQGGEVYFDSIAMFTFFLLTGRYLETRLRLRNQVNTMTLTQLLPLTSTRVVNNGSEQVPLNNLRLGDRVRIHSGETIPCDGVIVQGQSAVSEAILTGESEPVFKTIGERVIAGTVNSEGSFDLVVEALGEHTRLSTITRLVESAEQDKPRAQQLADRVASYFVLVVLIVSTVVFWSWWRIQPEHALWVTLSVLVVTCPCALSLATPTALTAAIANLTRQGFLILKSHALETLTNIDRVLMDKTGTLTEGTPKVSRILCLNDSLAAKEVLAIAAALEEGSSHPLALAFKPFRGKHSVREQNIQTGAGVSGNIYGAEYRLGKSDFVASTSHILPPDDRQWMLLAKNQQPVAWIGVEDGVRSSAAMAIQQLKEGALEVEVLSGDRQAPVRLLAKQLGIAYQAEHEPEEKLGYIKALQNKGHKMLMVGDGINDVPVLAGADLSLAMNSATDFARTKADCVLMHNDLSLISKAFAVAKNTKKIIAQNLAWALGYNLLALPLAAMGYIPPYLAAAGMSASSLIVVLNASRLYRA